MKQYSREEDSQGGEALQRASLWPLVEAVPLPVRPRLVQRRKKRRGPKSLGRIGVKSMGKQQSVAIANCELSVIGVDGGGVERVVPSARVCSVVLAGLEG